MSWPMGDPSGFQQLIQSSDVGPEYGRGRRRFTEHPGIGSLESR